jgi:hypothetical protein
MNMDRPYQVLFENHLIVKRAHSTVLMPAVVLFITARVGEYAV